MGPDSANATVHGVRLYMDTCSSINGTDVENLIFFEFIVYGVLLCFTSFLGLIGNVVSIFILSRSQMRSSLSLILIGLASFDSVVLITALLMFGVPAITPDYSYLPDALTWYSYPLGMIAQTGSVYFTVVVTTERYVAVCHPLRARYWCTYGRARLSVFLVSLFAVLYNIPRFFEFEISLTGPDRMSYALRTSDLRRNTTYIEVYIVWLYDIVMYIVPFALLAVLNGSIYNQVRKANQARVLLTNSQRKEIGLATMLLCVVVVFFICNILAFVVSILEAVCVLIPEMIRISNLFVTVNSSVNFFIYCTFGKKFRRLFLRYFCLCSFTFGRDSSQGRQGRSTTNIVRYVRRTSTVCSRMGAVNCPVNSHHIPEVTNGTTKCIHGKLAAIPGHVNTCRRTHPHNAVPIISKGCHGSHL